MPPPLPGHSPLVCLSHTLRDGMPAYPGDPSPRLTPLADVERDGYCTYQLQSGLHVGTHVDAPIHMVAGGKYIDELPPEAFMGRGRLVDVRGRASLGVEVLDGADVGAGDMVLLWTGHSRHFGTDTYYPEHPLVTRELAHALAGRHIKALGMDTPSPDRYPFEVHRILLGQDILLLENLTNLEALEGVKAFTLYALPFKVHAEAAPVNVIAAIDPPPAA